MWGKVSNIKKIRSEMNRPSLQCLRRLMGRVAGTPSLPQRRAETPPARTRRPSAGWRRCGRAACWSDPARTRSGTASPCSRPCKQTTAGILENILHLLCCSEDLQHFRLCKVNMQLADSSAFILAEICAQLFLGLKSLPGVLTGFLATHDP